MRTVRIYIVSCSCGTVALNTSATYADACVLAQAHKDLTGKCESSVRIHADDIPAALAERK